MSFAPLLFIWSSLTVLHYLIWIGLSLLVGVILPLSAKQDITMSGIAIPALLLPVAYGIFALIFGQIFGENYAAKILWPSGMILGALFTSLPFMDKALNHQASDVPVWFGLISIFVGANFFAFFIWLAPRLIDFGPIDLPKLSWGVQF